MRQLSILAIVILMLIFLAGCVQVKTVIKLNSNGSGIIEETVSVNKEIMIKF